MEIWKDIKSFEGLYQVSNFGNVKSVDRIIIEKTNDSQKRKSKQLKAFDNGGGYLVVHLRKNGKRFVRYVHRLVAETFIGNIKNMDINHKDFNRYNNSLDNLEIVTRKTNINYSLKAGHYQKIHENKIKETMKKYIKLKDEIVQDRKNGLSLRKIENKYCVNHKTLRKYGIC